MRPILKDVKVEHINGEDILKGISLKDVVYNMFELQKYTLKLEACPCWSD